EIDYQTGMTIQIWSVAVSCIEPATVMRNANPPAVLLCRVPRAATRSFDGGAGSIAPHAATRNANHPTAVLVRDVRCPTRSDATAVLLCRVPRAATRLFE